MSDVAIKVEHLSKRFRLGGGTAYKTLRDNIGNMARLPFRAARSLFQSRAVGDDKSDNIFWALRDVSFEIKQGEVIGIIGRNGAGKSTLLKVLSRITEPTEGWAQIHGRVGSLLEVGTGFHAELSGRENIYLNGAILGMSRSEITRKLDEIIDFAEVEKFVDTPVKHYSSGMYLRLAFAVAAHLEPEILIVDEVLAVGDAQFQKKCIGKMQNVAGAGRTVLFVSHNMTAIKDLCSRVLVMSQGQMVASGEPSEMISSYLSVTSQLNYCRQWETPQDAPGNEQIRVREIRVEGGNVESPTHISCNEPVQLTVEYWNKTPDAHLNLSVLVYNEERVLVFVTTSVLDNYAGRGFAKGLYRSTCSIPENLLNNGQYSISVLFVKDRAHAIFRMDDALVFEVHDSPELRGGWYGKWSGVIRPKLEWTTQQLEENGASVRSVHNTVSVGK